MKLHVDKEKLRTADEIKRLLRKHVLPVWGDRAFIKVRRRDVNDLLNAITKEFGAWTADHVLPHIRAIANWYAAQGEGDDYNSPFVKGMRRTRSSDRVRSRVLTDDELRKVWRTAEGKTDEPAGANKQDDNVEQPGGTFGALIRILLLTAQRRGVVVNMKRDAIKDNVTPKEGEKPVDGVWEIATEDRERRRATSARPNYPSRHWQSSRRSRNSRAIRMSSLRPVAMAR